VGEPYCRQTRLGEVRRGVLNVTVAHSTLLEELAAFRKPALLEAVRAGAPATTIHDIRFRVGPVVLEIDAARTMAPGSGAGRGAAELTRSTIRPRRAEQASGHKRSRSSGSNPVEP
jgi:hypothetical protein